MSKVLIVVDMQKDFIDGSLGTKEAQAIVPKVKSKIKEYVDNGHTVIFTRDTHTENYLNTSEGKNLPVVHCVLGTDGWQIPSEIDVPASRHIDKLTFGWTRWANLGFDGTTEFEVIGLCTDICVVSNVLILKATYPENKITVDASCCAGVTPDTHNAALTTMKMCQINVINEE